MAGYLIVGMLAAFGALCIGWIIYGFLLPRSGGTVLILDGVGSPTLRRCIWLQEIGLLDCSLAVWTENVSDMEAAWLKSQGIEIWNASCLGERFGTGAKAHGSGIGDPSGHHQCGGISEL